MDPLQERNLEALIQLDRKACHELYERYKSTFFGLCLRYARNRSDAQDMLQEGFVEIFKSMKSYQQKGSFEGWMKRILVRSAIGYTKKEYKFKFSELDDLELGIPASVNQSLDSEDLLSVIHQIPEKYALIFNLIAVEEYKSKEVATLLGLTDATVRSQYHRAKEMIKKELIKLKNPIKVY